MIQPTSILHGLQEIALLPSPISINLARQRSSSLFSLPPFPFALPDFVDADAHLRRTMQLPRFHANAVNTGNERIHNTQDPHTKRTPTPAPQ